MKHCHQSSTTRNTNISIPNVQRVGTAVSVTKIRRTRSSTREVPVDNIIHVTTRPKRNNLDTNSIVNQHQSQFKSNAVSQSLVVWPNRIANRSNTSRRCQRHRSLSPASIKSNSNREKNKLHDNYSATTQRSKEENNQDNIHGTLIDSRSLPRVTPVNSYISTSANNSFHLTSLDIPEDHSFPQQLDHHRRHPTRNKNQNQKNRRYCSAIPVRVRLLLLGVILLVILIIGLAVGLLLSSKKSITEISTTTSTTATTVTTTTVTTATTTTSTSSTTTSTTSTTATTITTTSTATSTTTTTSTSATSTSTTSSTSTTTATTSTSTTTSSTTTSSTSTSTTTTTSSTSSTSTTTTTTASTTTSSTSTTTSSMTSSTTTTSTTYTTSTSTSTTTTTSTVTTTTQTTTTSTTATTSTTTSTTTTQNPYACGNMTILVGYDLVGSDITSSNRANYTLCCAWCQSYSGCVAFTWGLPSAGIFIRNMCYLKSGVPSSSSDSTRVSAYY